LETPWVIPCDWWGRWAALPPLNQGDQLLIHATHASTSRCRANQRGGGLWVGGNWRQTQEVITAGEEEEEGLHRPDTNWNRKRGKEEAGLARSAAVLVKGGPQIEKHCESNSPVRRIC